jgi:hypothetical protein
VDRVSFGSWVGTIAEVPVPSGDRPKSVLESVKLHSSRLQAGPKAAVGFGLKVGCGFGFGFDGPVLFSASDDTTKATVTKASATAALDSG